MEDLATRLRKIHDSDHMRGCMGRQYSCTCGYDDQKDALVAEAAAALAVAPAQGTRGKLQEEFARRLANFAGNDFDGELMAEHDRDIYRKRAAILIALANVAFKDEALIDVGPFPGEDDAGNVGIAPRTPAAVEPAQAARDQIEIRDGITDGYCDIINQTKKTTIGRVHLWNGTAQDLRDILVPASLTPAECCDPPYEELRKTNVELMAKLREARSDADVFMQSNGALTSEVLQLRAQVEKARKQAFIEAMDELDKLRTLAATDFKSPNCHGQRGMDRTDAFYDAYHAIRRLSDTSTVSPSDGGAK